MCTEQRYTPSLEMRAFERRWRNAVIWKQTAPFIAEHCHHAVSTSSSYSCETWRDGIGGIFSNVAMMEED